MQAGRPDGFNSQPPEGGCRCIHSQDIHTLCFNSQPPEGGCQFFHCHTAQVVSVFQFTAARRRLRERRLEGFGVVGVSIHSRPKAAARGRSWSRERCRVSIHSRPKAAARCRPGHLQCPHAVSIHSRPKAAATAAVSPRQRRWRFNSQPPEGGCHLNLRVVL